MAEENQHIDDDDLKVKTDDEHGDDEHSGSDEHEDEGTKTSAESDEHIDPTLSDEEREQIRERRRDERKRRKEAQKEREESLRRELSARDRLIEEQNTRLMALERKSSGAEMGQLDAAIKQSAEAANYYKALIADASTKGDGATVADATEKMILARQRAEQLGNLKSQVTKQQSQARPALDPRLVSHAQGWMEKNKWYDPAGVDTDSKITLTIDTALASEGWDPKTPEYWQELSSRVKKYLPHRTKSDTISRERTESRKSTVAGSGREISSSGSTGDYKLSAERVQALRDAGMWDDPTKRAESIKRYREYDRSATSKK